PADVRRRRLRPEPRGVRGNSPFESRTRAQPERPPLLASAPPRRTPRYPMRVASRDRTARVAVLGSSVRRSRNDRLPSRGRSTMVRRGVLAVLVLVALALLTVSFRSPTSGALHDIQGYGASALRPFQVAAERVARPFQDVYGYFSGLANAKSENK